MRACPSCGVDIHDVEYVCRSCGHTQRDVQVGFTVRQVLDALGAPMAGDVPTTNDGFPEMLIYPPNLVVLFEQGIVAKLGAITTEDV